MRERRFGELGAANIEIGVIVAIVVAVLSGFAWVNQLAGRVDQILQSTDFVYVTELIHSAKAEALDAKKRATEEWDKVQIASQANATPVGTVVASLLDFQSFRAHLGETGDWDPNTSKWAPANGQSVAGSEYWRIKSGGTEGTETSVPDMRGLFLRGLNAIGPGYEQRADGKQDPDETRRTAGMYQADSFERHHHELRAPLRVGTQIHGPGWATDAPDVERSIATDERGEAAETRPRNVAVYYYVRIN